MAYEVKDNKVYRDDTEVAILGEDGKLKEYIGDGKKFRLPIAKVLKGLLQWAEPEHESSARAEIREEVKTYELPISQAFPDAPIGNPKLGDKDPTLVRWLHANHPEDYKHRYAGRKTVIEAEKPKEKSDTQLAVEAQGLGFDDASGRKGFDPDRHGLEGIFAYEYKVGYKLGGGIINE